MEGFLFWGISSIGRAVGLQPSGYGFESHIAPQSLMLERVESRKDRR